MKFEELMKESRQEGYDDGISAGIELGEQRGIEIGRLTVAAKMKAEGLPVEIIKKTTGLDDAAIEKL